jgi:hypothetical protein
VKTEQYQDSVLGKEELAIAQDIISQGLPQRNN